MRGLVDTGQGLHESLQHALQLRNDPRELYSVVSFLVTQRHKEFGIRRALGASTPSVLLGVIYGRVSFVHPFEWLFKQMDSRKHERSAGPSRRLVRASVYISDRECLARLAGLRRGADDGFAPRMR